MIQAVKTIALASLVVGALTAPTGAQGRINLQVALDKPVDLEVTDAPIGEVFRRLTQATGVKFLIGDDVFACLPYGSQTRLAVKLKNVTLRNALSPMLAPQAMEWIIEADAVRILPTPALLRMTRRATYDELRILGKIHSTKVLPTDQAGPVIDQLRKAVGNKDLDVVFHVETDRPGAQKRAERALPCTASAWLDMLSHGRGWTWYLWGDDILIVDRKMQVERQLRRLVTLRHDSARLVHVLLELAKFGRVKLELDPGVLDLVSAETKSNFSLIMADVTISQALEVISGATGLIFVRTPEGLRVEASERLRKPDPGAETQRQRSSFFIKKPVTLPDGSTIDIILRAEDLPEGIQEAINAEREKLFKLLIEKYGPTTRPATTQPAKP